MPTVNSGLQLNQLKTADSLLFRSFHVFQELYACITQLEFLCSGGTSQNDVK